MASGPFTSEIRITFDEDIAFVEGQQRRIEKYGMDQLVDIDSDGARLQMGRYLQRRIDQENGIGQVAAE